MSLLVNSRSMLHKLFCFYLFREYISSFFQFFPGYGIWFQKLMELLMVIRKRFLFFVMSV